MVDVDPTGAARRPPFVWTHGLTSSMAHEDETGLFDWSELVPAGRRVVRYDVRGHRESGFTHDPRACKWDELALDLVALIDRLGIERAGIGGASLGSAVSLHAAARAPERVGGLVLAIPPTAWTTRAEARLIEQRGVGSYIAACRRVVCATRPSASPARPSATEQRLVGCSAWRLRSVARMGRPAAPTVNTSHPAEM